MDLQNSSDFQALDVALLSIAADPANQQAPEAQALGITTPMLVDLDGRVTRAFGADEFALSNGEPSHTFALVDKTGQIVWFKDYGAPDNPNRTMYVEVNELVRFIRANLK
ncbi:MAG: redoxin domain-containing protein [Anaerolineales bacterium]|nr:redoxin domain-containing protein [Anaerolineales bacterium]